MDYNRSASYSNIIRQPYLIFDSRSGSDIAVISDYGPPIYRYIGSDEGSSADFAIMANAAIYGNLNPIAYNSIFDRSPANSNPGTDKTIFIYYKPA
jgi:hypothetical protein